MRDGPPLLDETMSSETLLREIASLRSRLRELEEDGRSSICESFVEGDVNLSLKKEVVKLIDEKAKQEQEFMNQMSSLAVENQSIIANLKSKLARCRAEKEDLEDRVGAMASAHAAEVDQLKENITRADEEIAETKHEMDFLHQEKEELSMERKELADDVQAMKLELENEKRRTESFRVQLKKSEGTIEQLRLDVSAKDIQIEGLREDIGEMNDSMVEVDEAKTMAEEQLKALRIELTQTKEQLKREKTKSIDHSIFSAERESLERANEQLEERLERFQSKLAEKDATIESLTNSLKEERGARRKIRKEMEGRENGTESRDEPAMGLSRSLHGTRDTNQDKQELEYLRRRNKSLNEEVRELRRKLTTSEGLHHGEARHEAQNGTPKTPGVNTVQCTPPRSKKAPDMAPSPRNAVSGLVASFEKRSRTNRPGEDKREDGDCSGASDWSPSADRSTENRETSRSIKNLEMQLQEEHETVERLRKQLTLAKAESDSMDSLEKKLEKSHDMVESLQKKISSLEKEKRQYIIEIDQMQYELKVTKEIAELEEEKKEEETEEELYRLRSQVGALQSELSSAMEEIMKMNDNISTLQSALEREKRVAEESQSTANKLKEHIDEIAKESSVKERASKVHDAEINKLTVELTNAQVAKDAVETELSNRIQELQTELEAVEIEANEEIEKLKSELSTLQLSVSRKDLQIQQLETEKNQLCSNMSMASNAKNDEFEELQSELIDKTAKNTSQAREIQALKMKIEELESVKRSKAEWLQSRVNELEQEMEILRASTKNSGSWEDIERLRRENISLKESIREMKMERRHLQERIESLVTDRSTSKSAQILRDRNASLKDEVEKLTRRLKKMEESITRFAI